MNELEGNEFLYVFAYEDLAEHRLNESEGTDFESVGFFRIRASSEEMALSWGQVLSNWYVARIYDDEAPGRWARGRFASWLEDKPDAEMWEAASAIDPVAVGEYPDLSQVRSLLRD